MRFHDIELAVSSLEVRRGLRKVQLSPTNFLLLAAMLETPGRVWTRQQLAAAAWPHATDFNERNVDVQIGRLRRALSRHKQDNPIKTVRGMGYMLRTYEDQGVSASRA